MDNTEKEGQCYTHFSGDFSDTYSYSNYETYALLLTPEERLIAAGEITKLKSNYTCSAESIQLTNNSFNELTVA